MRAGAEIVRVHRARYALVIGAPRLAPGGRATFSVRFVRLRVIDRIVGRLLALYATWRCLRAR